MIKIVPTKIFDGHTKPTAPHSRVLELPKHENKLPSMRVTWAWKHIYQLSIQLEAMWERYRLIAGPSCFEIFASETPWLGMKHRSIHSLHPWNPWRVNPHIRDIVRDFTRSLTYLIYFISISCSNLGVRMSLYEPLPSTPDNRNTTKHLLFTGSLLFIFNQHFSGWFDWIRPIKVLKRM